MQLKKQTLPKNPPSIKELQKQRRIANQNMKERLDHAKIKILMSGRNNHQKSTRLIPVKIIRLPSSYPRATYVLFQTYI